MKKVLIIPDVHGRSFWKRSVERFLNDYPLEEDANKDNLIIFLGDYVDPYALVDRVSETAACDNLHELLGFYDKLAAIHPDSVVMLLGNHDLHYIYDTGEDCRLDYGRYRLYKKAFSERFADGRIKIAHTLTMNPDSEIHWLFSHAGIQKEWFLSALADYDMKCPDISAENVAKILNDNQHVFLKQFAQVSYYRGGLDLYGSCLWADVDEMIDNNTLSLLSELSGNGSINQVFGHSYSRQAYINAHSGVYMLDIGFSSFLLDENDNLEAYPF